MTVVKIAAAEIGTRENPQNSNNVKYNTWFYGQAVYDGLWGTKFPWCMAFVQWCFDRAGTPLPYKTASCSALVSWYKANQPQAVVKEPQTGDIVVYAYGHTGIVESVKGKSMTVIEGNTAVGNNSDGGEVMRRTRRITETLVFLRPFSEKSEDEMTVQELLDKLTDAEAYALVEKAQRYAASLKAPAWAAAEIAEAEALGITDGETPMQLIPRYQAAIMACRSARKNGNGSDNNRKGDKDP